MDYLRNFFKSPESDYEKVLADLDQQIHHLEIALAEYRITERSWGIKLLAYSALGYFSLITYVFILDQPTFYHLLTITILPLA